MSILEPFKEEIIDLYKQGYSTYKIGELYDVSDETVRVFLHKCGVALRGRGNRRVYYKNLCAFDDLSKEDVQYWIGFLYADGHISKNNYVLKLELGEKDVEHLLAFKEFIGFSGGLRKEEKIVKGKKYTTYAILINSHELVSKLCSIGFNHNKTFSDIVLPDELLCSKHFWRGMIDGDGWLSFITVKNMVKEKRYPIKVFIMGICGHISIIDRFKEFAIFVIPDIRYKIFKKENYAEIVFRNKKAYLLMKYIYDSATIYLPRKYEVFLKAKKYYERQQWRILSSKGD